MWAKMVAGTMNEEVEMAMNAGEGRDFGRPDGEATPKPERGLN
jgi:hypothetical protein